MSSSTPNSPTKTQKQHKTAVKTTTPSIHCALTINNITNFIKITLDIEKSQYTTWSELFTIHAQAYDVLDHIIPSTVSTSTSPPLKETDSALWKRLDVIVLQWI